MPEKEFRMLFESARRYCRQRSALAAYQQSGCRRAEARCGPQDQLTQAARLAPLP